MCARAFAPPRPINAHGKDTYNMKEVFLCKYGEIALKGLNKSTFERQLIRTVEKRAARYGEFKVSRAQSAIYVEPLTDTCDMDGCMDALLKIFGIAAVSRAAETEKNMEAIRACAAEYLPRHLAGVHTFKADARRSDKRFPLTSPQISADIGGVVLSAVPGIRVDVENPERIVRVEIRDRHAYVNAGQFHGAGGMPVGTGGKGLLLLSGGIDSPVAGYMMAKRGMALDALHFESYPYTSEQAKGKVLELARLMSAYCGPIRVHVVSLTAIQEELRRTCDESYFTLLLRRFMMRLANRACGRFHCGGIVTGESLGQVARQTLPALHCTNAVARYPVLRPCIGMDKDEIVRIARKIDTFETSILPYEDCCTVFTPRHPRTNPDIARVEEEEAKTDVTALEDAAFATLDTVICDIFA